jgi:ribose transport system permease protein/L-arabinose transport system permease protein
MSEARIGEVDRPATPPVSPLRSSMARVASLLRPVVRFIGTENLSLVLVLAIEIAVIVSQSKYFLGQQNLLNSLGQNIAVLGVLAVGESVVIIAGALDISVGSIAGIAGVTAALVLTGTGSMQLGLVAGIFAGICAGLVNGSIVAFLRVNPIIATLGTYAAFRGVAFLIAPNGYPVGVGTHPDFDWLGSGRILENGSFVGIPIILIILVLVAIVGHVLLSYTDFGRSIYALGGNATAARLAGINLTRVRLGMYAFCGITAGLGGVLLAARTTSGAPLNGQGMELQAITAVFLGGAATTGGKGTVMGTVLAVLILGILSNGMNLLGVQQFWQDVATGMLLVTGVAIAQYRALRSERARTRIAFRG